MIATGGYSTCVLKVTGAVTCWGQLAASERIYGGLGGCQALAPECFSPLDMPDLQSDITFVSMGLSHVCVLTTGGGAKCLGDNGYGQLGDGQSCGEICWLPVDVSGLTSGVASISAGENHTCALTSGGAAKCWGQDNAGQIGDGTYEGNSCSCNELPVDVSGLDNGVQAVSAGGSFSCALTDAGAVKCWGSDTLFQLGDGGACFPWCRTPVDVAGLQSGIVSITAGRGNQACALTEDGAAECWGNNDMNQVGAVTSESCGGLGCTARPVDVVGLHHGIAAISAGEFHTCATTQAGNVICWGSNQDGELGDGGHCPEECLPVLAVGLGPAPPGNVNCDAATDSIDAALLLQLTAGLIPSLVCPEDADVDNSSVVDPVDSSLILQFAAGLIVLYR